jgi:Flp pilus assembly secretin CpaC
MTALCVRRLAALAPLCFLATALVVATAVSRAVADETVIVHLDEARVLKLPDRATTVVIGNPLVADLSVQAGGIAVVTGKSFGATNVIVMDKAGAILTEHTVQVEGPVDQTVVMYRGVNRETYSCMPDCSPRITLGDDTKYFTDTITQAATRNTQSLAAGAGAH